MDAVDDQGLMNPYSHIRQLKTDTAIQTGAPMQASHMDNDCSKCLLFSVYDAHLTLHVS